MVLEKNSLLHTMVVSDKAKQGKETTRRHFSVPGICMSLSSLDTWWRMGHGSSYTYNEQVALKHTYIAETYVLKHTYIAET